jgi:nucleoside-diphosphate-sugar epimerase
MAIAIFAFAVGAMAEMPKRLNIGSEEMISINDLAKMVIGISDKNIKIKNLYGQEFINKYGYKCPLGVKGRNSNNDLFKEKVGQDVYEPLEEGMKKLYNWIKTQTN